ncbi:type IV secretion system protein [Bartonella machadoae]|uniref:type IV secretion system protein n=1 Tax=Bartonella machadoae TaxID=2893471 RepID=UPI001F4C9A9E|nr:type IV secretion system protein [Bartonella machadoae]UNE54101.1 hypothetical protein LNM86_11260 [Bartonella machadoae]
MKKLLIIAGFFLLSGIPDLTLAQNTQNTHVTKRHERISIMGSRIVEDTTFTLHKRPRRPTPKKPNSKKPNSKKPDPKKPDPKKPDPQKPDPKKPDPKKPEQKEVSDISLHKHATEIKAIVDLLNEQLALNKALLEQKEKIYTSITGSRTNAKQVIDEGLYLPNPHLIYNETEHTKVLRNKSKVQDIVKEENNLLTNQSHARTSTNQRLKHAVAIDKAVSLQTFHETEERFTKIKKMLEETGKTQDLKSMLEMQAHIHGMRAMIKNESIRLQMVAHFRNAEQALIKQRKRALHSQVFKKEHKDMPKIRINGNVRS